MKRQYIQYHLWEDWKAGMWEQPAPIARVQMLQDAIEFTGDHARYGKAMMKVIYQWPNTMIHNLTNKSINYRAFIGHCAVCMELGIPECVTREAWGYLSNEQRELADNQAEIAFKYWKRSYLGLIKAESDAA